MTQDGRPAILITGAAGGLASLLVDSLKNEYRLVGVDPRPMPQGRNFPGEFHQIEYNHRKMAEVFRKNHFKTLLHLGRIRTSRRMSTHKQFHLNVIGTRNLLDLSRRYGLKNLIVFSTYHVYGAHQLNPIYLTEDEPLRASQTFPELMDAIELDHAATTFLWRYRDIRTMVLRPVNVIGPRINNTISTLLRAEFCPKLMGYDPLMQFIHEKDICGALELCLKGDKSGVYNIAGEGTVPYGRAIQLAESISIPVPAPVAYSLVGTLSKLKLAFPKHLVNYFKYPTVVSDAAFKNDFQYSPSVSTVEALRSIKTK
ncbi:MAG: NAD-dependent epimerase [Bdellovibrionaceae bacterium]|nr:NAD-dependent epimerase [Pseudobdellovibrionaceae bacterium]